METNRKEFTPTEFSIKKPSNAEMAKHFGYKNESAVRAQRKKYENGEVGKSDSSYIKNLNQYLIETQPFISIDNFANKFGVNKAKLLKKQEKNKIPTMMNKKYSKKKQENTLTPFVPFNLNETEELKEDIKSFKKATVITVANTSGGAGKTTNAVNLGTALSFQGYNVLLIDFDTQSNASQNFNLRPGEKVEKTIIDLMLEVGQSLPNATQSVKDSIHSFKDKLNTIGKFDIIANSGDNENVNKLIYIEEKLRLYGTAFKSLDMIIDTIRDDYDFVIIDTSPTISLSTTITTLATDYFILSYRPEKKAVAGMPMFVDKLKLELEPVYKANKKQPIKIIGGIMTDFDTKDQRSQEWLDIAKDDFDAINTKFNSNKDWNIFNSTIIKSVKFADVLYDSYGTLFSPMSFDTPLEKNTANIIKSYLSICNELIEKIVIDKFAQEEI